MDTKALKEQLGNVELFTGLPKRAIALIVNSGREIHHPDGHEVIAEGAGAIGFHFITAGTARVTAAGAVRRDLGVGDYFGEVSVVDGQPRSASVEALNDLTTFMIHPSVVRSLIDENPKFARELLLLLCRRLREAERRTA